MKIYFLGTCSGTEPMEGMHHCSLVMEVGEKLYWFDAGENCSYTAFMSGLDVMKTVALFVSHAHIDHVGGLANLFHCMRKMNWRYGKEMLNGSLKIFFPDPIIFEGIKRLAVGAINVPNGIQLQEHPVEDGVLFEDDQVRVTALHNGHIARKETDPMRSFSFLVETEGKRIVFSGDVGRPEDLDPFLKNGADVLIMETGHHRVVDVCNYALAHNVKTLRFNHHGREIIEKRPEMEQYVNEFAKQHEMSILLCYDGMVETF